MRGRSNRVPVLVVTLAIFGGIMGFTLLAAQRGANSTAKEAPLIAAVRTAMVTDMMIVTLPAGSSAGHVSASVVSELKDQLARELPNVYTGTLLTTELQALSTYVDAVALSENIGVNTGAGITSLTIDTSILSTSHATVHGKYSVWVTGRHMEDGHLKDDRAEATYTFTAGLDQVLDTWLVSSWDDQQIS